MFLRTAILCLVATSVLAADYGLDCSFPIHSKDSSCGNLLGDRKTFYEDYIKGCRKFYGKKGSRCDVTEQERLVMSKRQPQSMVSYPTRRLWESSRSTPKRLLTNHSSSLTLVDRLTTPILASKRSRRQRLSSSSSANIGNATKIRDPKRPGQWETHTSTTGHLRLTWSVWKTKTFAVLEACA